MNKAKPAKAKMPSRAKMPMKASVRQKPVKVGMPTRGNKYVA